MLHKSPALLVFLYIDFPIPLQKNQIKLQEIISDAFLISSTVTVVW